MTDELRDSVPLTGLEVESAQFEGLDEDGVITAPVVRVTLLAEDRRFVFAVPAELGKTVADSIGQASMFSLARYYTPRQMEAQLRQDRRRKRIAIAVLGCALGAYMASVGLAESKTFTHTGGVVEGVIAALDAGWQFIGMLAVFGFLSQYIRRRRRERRNK